MVLNERGQQNVQALQIRNIRSHRMNRRSRPDILLLDATLAEEEALDELAEFEEPFCSFRCFDAIVSGCF